MVSIQKTKILIVCLFFSQCIYSAQYNNTELVPVSLIKLILEPDQFSAKKIHVAGYYSDFSSAIYLSKELSILSLGADSVKLIDNTEDGDLINSKCINNYISVIGTFQQTSGRNPYFYITDVTSVKYINNGGLEYCYKKKLTKKSKN